MNWKNELKNHPLRHKSHPIYTITNNYYQLPSTITTILSSAWREDQEAICFAFLSFSWWRSLRVSWRPWVPSPARRGSHSSAEIHHFGYFRKSQLFSVPSLSKRNIKPPHIKCGMTFSYLTLHGGGNGILTCLPILTN